MPQANDELRAKMGKYFGDEIDLHGPYQFLKAAGYKDVKGYLFMPKDHVMSEKEGDCVDFLCDEWDFAFGGKEGDKPVEGW